MKIAIYIEYRNWLNNQMFELDSECNINNVLDRYVALKRYLDEKNIKINTYDIYKNIKEVDLWLIIDPKPKMLYFFLKSKINPKKIVPILHEPSVINPWAWQYLRYYSWIFPALLTWNSELCSKNKKYFHYHFPLKIDLEKYNYYKSKNKKNLLLMMHSNKHYPRRGELYSLRKKIIKYYEERGDGLLDLYGKGWNNPKSSNPFYTTLYRGTTDDKWETYSEYYFTFCIDNSIVPGYITYDPLISMATGTVPIYQPMPDSTKYIPENTFIDFSKFKNLRELTEYLQSIVGTPAYEEYRTNGWNFINSEKYYPFTMKKFCEDIYEAINFVIKK